MARPPNTDIRRQEIANALIRVMAARGYAGASINEIAREANLSPGLIHYHFKNKREILLAAAAQLIAEHESAIAERLDGADSPPQQVAAFIDAHLSLGPDADPDRLASWLVINTEALRQPEVHALFNQTLTSLTDRLETAVRRGTTFRHFSPPGGNFSPNAARDIAVAIVAAIQGYFVLAATSPALVPSGSAARSTRLMAEGLLGGELSDPETP